MVETMKNWEDMTDREKDAKLGFHLGTVSENIYNGYMSNWEEIELGIQKYGITSKVPYYNSNMSATMEAEEEIFKKDLQEYHSLKLIIVLGIRPHELLMLDDVFRLINASAKDRCFAMYLTIL